MHKAALSFYTLCLASSLVLTSLPASAASISSQRSLYTQAKAAMDKKDPTVYLANQRQLKNYPLTPYLAYEELSLRLDSASTQEVERFLKAHDDLPQSRWLKLRWLRNLAKNYDWKTFDRYYSAELNFTELDCLSGQSHLYQGRKQQAFALADQLWLSGQSQPNACDPLFAAWQDAGLQTEEKRWERLKLAVQARNYGLANYLVKQLAYSHNQAQLLIAVSKNPERLNDRAQFASNHPLMGEIVLAGLTRLARQSPETTIPLLADYSRQFSFSPEQQLSVARTVALTLAKRFDAQALPIMATYDPELKDDSLSEWRTRLLLRLERWSEAHQLIKRFPQHLAETNRWRYWLARTEQLANPRSQQITPLFNAIPQERDFYSFLAADFLHQPYVLTHIPVKASQSTLKTLEALPGTQRAQEFYARGEVIDARREWYHVGSQLSAEQLKAQAQLAFNMNWYFPAIRGLGLAKHLDDLVIRFPTPYKSSLIQYAKAQSISPSWAMAITRQESGFMEDARSHAGALGLMQLMPATARETAKRYQINLPSNAQVLNPTTNIQLGTAYLNQVASQFNGNRVLASAAYNAGPGRVRQWLRGAEHLPYDVWAETIPFDETRLYVHNVLTYAVIYGKKLNVPTSVVEPSEKILRL